MTVPEQPIEPLDLLAFGPHPDDAELLCGGTLALMADRGYRVGVVDLTAGEMGTRGSVSSRRAEARAAAEILGLVHREGLDLPDAGIDDTDDQRARVTRVLRKLKPRTVIIPFTEGRHPDHGAASRLVRSACFLAGLASYAPGGGTPVKPSKILLATAFRDHDSDPRFVVDITPTFERKMAAVRCYGSQFDGRDQGGELFPSGRDFYTGVETKFAWYGSAVQY